MPCILKKSSKNSPGIITFTHNEVLRGLPARSKKIREFLTKMSKENKWIFGVHIQGNCQHMQYWPVSEWESFYMWGDIKNSKFLSNIQDAKIIPLTAEYFLPKNNIYNSKKKWDICIVSRPSKIKRIEETLYTIKELFKLKKDLKVIFIVPDPRIQSQGSRTYKLGIDEKFFKLPKLIFSCTELKNITFLSSSQESFGNFPIPHSFIQEIISRSKFIFINSYLEGGPRVLAEAFSLNVPCIVSNKLQSGLRSFFNEKNIIEIDDSPKVAANQILRGLNNYKFFDFKYLNLENIFNEEVNQRKLKELLEEKFLILKNNNSIWYLNDLLFRLPCHGYKNDMQFFYNENLFFEWIKGINNLNKEFSEDILFSEITSKDKKKFSFFDIKEYLKGYFILPILNKIKKHLFKSII